MENNNHFARAWYHSNRIINAWRIPSGQRCCSVMINARNTDARVVFVGFFSPFLKWLRVTRWREGCYSNIYKKQICWNVLSQWRVNSFKNLIETFWFNCKKKCLFLFNCNNNSMANCFLSIASEEETCTGEERNKIELTSTSFDLVHDAILFQ